MKKMRIGIIDADLLGRKKHRFPNLVCEKISMYWKEKGAQVELKLDYENLDQYDEVYISKVFTDTQVPRFIEEGVDIMILDADYIYTLDNFDGAVDEYAEEFDEFLTLEKFNAASNEITCEIQGWQPKIDDSKIINWLYNEYPCRIKRWKP